MSILMMKSRHCYRWSDIDFEANAKEGIAVDWTIRYKDIAPWYDYVESFIGVSGQKEGLKQVPDGKTVWSNTCEKLFRKNTLSDY